MKKLAALVASLLVASLVAPMPALAHGLVGVGALPLPKWLFAWAAAAVLVASFVGLGALWSSPRFERSRERVLVRLPAVLDPLLGVVGVAIFVAVIYAGLAGEQVDPTGNLAPTAIFVILWVGVPVASAVLGDVFRPVNPWRAIGRLARWDRPAVPYPPRLGRWPAAAGIAGFAWLELVYVHKDDPRRLAWLALAYAAVQLMGMARYGVDAWCDNADALGVYFGLFARLSPLRWSRRALHLRLPLAGAVGLDTPPGTVALLAVMIGSTSFDGFMNGPVWKDAGPGLQSVFSGLGMGAQGALEAGTTLGMLCALALVGSLYRLGVIGMRTVGGRHTADELGRRFVHTLVPIALAYVVAHYFSMLVYQGQAVWSLASDPLGNGSNLFGTAATPIHYGVIGANGIWLVQVAALLVGHVGGLVLAHDRAMVVFRTPRQAMRSQYWMLAIMVSFTCLALWLLAASS